MFDSFSLLSRPGGQNLPEVPISIVSKDFPDFFDGWGDDQLSRCLSDGVSKGIEDSFRQTFGGDIVKLSTAAAKGVTTAKGSWQNGNLNFASISASLGFTTSGITVTVDTPKNFQDNELTIISSDPNISFGYQLFDNTFQKTPPRIKFKQMKRWNRHIITFYQITVSPSVIPFDFRKISACECDVNTLKPVYHSQTILHFSCYVCGKSHLCECFKGIAEAQASRSNFHKEPYEQLLESTSYKNGICHLCRGIPSTTGHMDTRGGVVRAYYSSYIHAFAMINGFDWHLAENTVRDRLGVPRIGEGWLAEANLLRIVQGLFHDQVVLHQASPEWLGSDLINLIAFRPVH